MWDPLAARLDVHAIAEEEIFYPELLRVGEDPEDETLDAIGDHNDIRDGVHEAARHPLGTESGGTRWAGRGWRTTSTWARRSTRASRTSA